ncbi:MAG: cell division protein ZapA [Candidatus Latescibacteria bacterium]|nr:cell division protein ZapA [Candidatus Latescibacterota bacterium]
MPDGDPTNVSIDVFGRSYTIVADSEQAPERIRLVAQLVDEKMRQIHQENASHSLLQLAVLVGLDLVDELLQLRAEYDNAESNIIQRTTKLNASLGRLFSDVGIELVPSDSAEGQDRKGVSS